MNTQTNERLHAIVEGMVQGVNFRFYTMRKARSLGLTGWVANRADGAVEAVAEGNRADLEVLLVCLHEGPPEAVVSRANAQWQPATGEFRSFTIRH